MSCIATKIYFLFERRQSPKHKWILARGCNGKVPTSLEEASSVYFVPSRWDKTPHDAQGAQFLSSIMPKHINSSDSSILSQVFSSVVEFRKANRSLAVVITSEQSIEKNRKHMSTQVNDILQESAQPIIYQSALNTQELVQFIDDLSEDEETKDQHTILQLIFRHIQLKICSLQYPHVRVHLIVTLGSPPTPLLPQTVELPALETENMSIEEIVNIAKNNRTEELPSAEILNAEQSSAQLLQTHQKENIKLEEVPIIVSQVELKIEPTSRVLQQQEKESSHQLHVANVYDFSGDGWDIEDVIDIPPLVSLPDDLLDKNTQTITKGAKDGKEEEEEEDDDSFSSDEAPPPPSVATTIVETIPVPTLSNILPQFETKCETFPLCFSLLGSSTILAMSEKKEETRCVTRWIQQKLQRLYSQNNYSLCFISQNFSESDCIGIETYVEDKRAKGEFIVVGVECEFATANGFVDRQSRDCTTLLNEFDGRTSLLILKLIGCENTTIVFETTKPFNHVWCSKYNIVNTPSSQWFAKASRLHESNMENIHAQRNAQAAAVVQLVCHQSEQAAALVRCAANQHLQQTNKTSFFDAAVLGCHADYNEKQRIFNWINDQCLQHKLEHTRWQKRVVRLENGDAFYIPISDRQNDQLYETVRVEALMRSKAIAGATGAFIPSPTDYRKPPVQRSAGIFGVFSNSQTNIPPPSSYIFTTPATDFQFGDPYVLKNVSLSKLE